MKCASLKMCFQHLQELQCCNASRNAAYLIGGKARKPSLVSNEAEEEEPEEDDDDESRDSAGDMMRYLIAV